MPRLYLKHRWTRHYKPTATLNLHPRHVCVLHPTPRRYTGALTVLYNYCSIVVLRKDGVVPRRVTNLCYNRLKQCYPISYSNNDRYVLLLGRVEACCGWVCASLLSGAHSDISQQFGVACVRSSVVESTETTLAVALHRRVPHAERAIWLACTRNSQTNA